MKSNAWIIGGLLLALVLAFGLGQSFTGSSLADEPQQRTVARYQISAYAGTTGAGVGHGCYIVDTTTGQVWHTLAGGTIQKVSGAPQ
jgi:hypothetical protein